MALVVVGHTYTHTLSKVKDGDNKTALDYAREKKEVALIEILTKVGPPPPLTSHLLSEPYFAMTNTTPALRLKVMGESASAPPVPMAD